MLHTQISERFKNFAIKECQGSSSLYEYLSLKIAEDEEILALSSYARRGQPIPNMLFGAVHYLLLKGAEHSLKNYYPSIVELPNDKEDSFTPFRSFCQLYRDEIISILKTKLVQTNEVRRCGYLYPCFSHIYSLTNKPLSLIEIGTSAGFQLLWDKYRYSYDAHTYYGNRTSNVKIHTEIKGDNIPQMLDNSPPVMQRFGLDLHINDVTVKEDSLWLSALIWPEHEERRALFEQAVGCIENYKDEITLIEGDGVELLLRLAEQIPLDTTLCIFHTHVANQMPKEIRQKLLNQVSQIGANREVYHLYNNIWDGKLHLDSFINGKEYNEIVCETDGHGRWFSWEPSSNLTKN